jgi:hypothetical protein
MFSKGISGALVLLLALLVVPGAALAQVETGSITGTVTDPQGAVVTGATVTATSQNGATRTVRTSGDGSFNFSSLNPGRYEVKVEGAGFGAKTATVDVSVGTRTALDVSLEVTGGGEEVDVIAGEQGIQVNTENQTLQSVVSERELKELPTITRNPYALVQLSGNVSPDNASGRGAGFAINGQRSASTNVLLDGADNNDLFTAVVGQDVPLDAVQEFTVLTSNFSAEFGRAGGGIVNVATKSGTNEFHGTVYEFNRISRLASKDFNLNALYPPSGTTENKKGVFTRNQFGYSIGGPIVKDKLLFFNSIEWLRVRSQDTASAFVPTPEFIAAAAPATQNFFSGASLRTPINGRILFRGDLAGGATFNALPAGLPILGEVIYSVPADAGGGLPQNSYQIVGRADYNWTDKTTVYVRYALQDIDQFAGTVSTSPYAGFDTGGSNFNNNILGSVTHVWSDNCVSQTKFVYNRLNGSQPLGENPAGPTLYLSSGAVASRTPGNDLIALPGYLPYSPGSGIPFGGPQNLSQFFQDQTWTLGDHTLRFGGTYVRIHDNRVFGAYQNATEQLGNTLANGLENFTLGLYRQFNGAIDPKGGFPGDILELPTGFPDFSRRNRYNEWALYVNDSWKIHPRVTLNLGLRYDYFGVQHNADPSLDSNFYYGEGATIEEQFANGEVFIASESPTGSLWKKDYNNFGPRLGIAWDVFGDGKTSLRGGYGISYERNFGNVTFNVIQNPPAYAVVQLVPPGGAPIVTDPLGPLAGTGTVTIPRTSLRHVDQNIDTAYAHFWSASLEREIFGTAVVSAEYSGSKGVNLYSIIRRNLPGSAVAYGLPFTPTAIPGVQPSNGLAYSNPRYGLINTRGSDGRSNYHGLTLSIDSRVIGNTGLQFQAKYTWSHALDNLSSTFSESGNNFNLGYLDPNNTDLDYGSTDFDVRHRFVSSGIWDIPFANDTEGWAKHLLDGWQMTYIYTARTGQPFTVFDCTNAFFVFCPRLNNAGGLQLEGFDNPRETEGENPNTFDFIDLTNQLGQVGTAGGNQAVNDYFGGLVGDYGPFPSNMTARNAFRGPGFWQVDGGIYKNVELTERYRMQFRAEFYNVFNHANLFVNSGNADISAGPIITASKAGRRQIQLALKFIF